MGEEFARRMLACICMTIICIAFFAVLWPGARTKPFYRPIHPTNNHLLETSEHFVIALNNPMEFDRMSAEDVLDIRKKYLAPHIGKLVSSYDPTIDVFVDLVDGAPWWGLDGIYFYGPGEYAIDGPSEESRFVANPLLLAGLIESNAHITSYMPLPGVTFYPKPDSLVFEGNKKVTVHYRIGGYLSEMKRISAVDSSKQLTVVAYNAKDLGFNYLAFSPDGLKGVSVPKLDSPVQIQQFIHLGRSCGYRAGCNNMSPYQPDLEIRLASLPAEIPLRFWRIAPASAHDAPDLVYTIKVDM